LQPTAPEAQAKINRKARQAMRKHGSAIVGEAQVRALAEALNIPLIGITDPAPFNHFLPRLQARQRANGGTIPFVRTEAEKRIDFRSAMPAVQTVIVIGVPYPLFPERAAVPGEGHIASVACGEDYHRVVGRKMAALVAALKALSPEPHAFQTYVDNSRLIDKASAWRAGLGFFGKNNLLIHPDYGSAFNIGQILTDLPVAFTEAVPMPCRCGDCDRCLKACPTGALGEGFALDYTRCLSNLTQQKRLSPEEEARIQTFVYGCDYCQWSCPFNRQAATIFAAQAYGDLAMLSEMTEADFKKIFGERSLAWRGAAVIRRNARLVKAKKTKK
jgi:epoxyqueuosine reductase